MSALPDIGHLSKPATWKTKTGHKLAFQALPVPILFHVFHHVDYETLRGFHADEHRTHLGRIAYTVMYEMFANGINFEDKRGHTDRSQLVKKLSLVKSIKACSTLNFAHRRAQEVANGMTTKDFEIHKDYWGSCLQGLKGTRLDDLPTEILFQILENQTIPTLRNVARVGSQRLADVAGAVLEKKRKPYFVEIGESGRAYSQAYEGRYDSEKFQSLIPPLPVDEMGERALGAELILVNLGISGGEHMTGMRYDKVRLLGSAWSVVRIDDASRSDQERDA